MKRISALSPTGLALSLSLAVLLAASSAHALTITNQDSDAHKVKIIKGNDNKELTIASQAKADADCKGGCIVELEDSGDKYDMKGPESISIQDGVIYVDADPTIGNPPALPNDHSTDQPASGDGSDVPPQ